MNAQNQYQAAPNSQLLAMAERLSIDANELQNIVMNTIMPSQSGRPSATTEQVISFLAVANEYNLNPLTKEIYAFPAKGGGIQAIVSIDGWLKIINSHKQFDGMVFNDCFDESRRLFSVTCSMFRKDRKHPVEVTEYFNECNKETEPWKKWPARMLRHKAAIQAARYAFGFSGIVDPDEGERIQESTGMKDVTPNSESVYADGETVSSEQVSKLIETAKAAGLDEEYVCRAGNVENIYDLEAIRFEPALNHLKAKALKFSNEVEV